MTPTLGSHLSSAELCRRNGWGPGTVLESIDRGLGVRIRITAVGDVAVLAVHHLTLCGAEWLGDTGFEEEIWQLSHRAWKAVGDGAP